MSLGRIGFLANLAASTATVAYETVQILQVVGVLHIPALRDTGVERRARVARIAHVAATVLAGVVYFYPTYSQTLLLVGFPWGVTAPLFMVLLGLALRARDTQSRA